jgi:hypothetical protein
MSPSLVQGGFEITGRWGMYGFDLDARLRASSYQWTAAQILFVIWTDLDNIAQRALGCTGTAEQSEPSPTHESDPLVGIAACGIRPSAAYGPLPKLRRARSTFPSKTVALGLRRTCSTFPSKTVALGYG